MNTTENNKLIAEFMVVDLIDGQEGEYHTSWEWLMPVVEKIEEIALEDVDGSYKVHRFNVKIESFYCVITDGKDEHRELIVADDGDKKSNVYYAVVEFIKWYNENK